MKIFSIYDRQAQMYGALFECQTQIEAMRQFERLSSNTESFIHQYPTSFELHELGSFDKQTGWFCLEDKPNNLGTAQQFAPRHKITTKEEA